MTNRFEAAVEAARRVAPMEQDALAEVMMSATRIGEEDPIPPEDLADVLEGLTQIERGEDASGEEVEAAFRRFRSWDRSPACDVGETRTQGTPDP